ncbi:ABC transporter permease [Lihuaxuella thermophila]|uniref:ABC-type transport system, involved in lipoprotein release, permease component n=1 Tax=Lihuaxuella thermophila TaxID=1173111 RepID=A0A1H8G6D7_9BACL|nr:FtsX-like permease family protein [Lihuaxuella thermophila]SEN39310.1 ABC-type transport system, involved in lipoprotein release, permease component [Lihuaxuella thermophila]
MVRKLGDLAWRFFLKRKARALFSIAGVSLGVMLLTVSLIMTKSIELSVEQTIISKYGERDMSVGYLSGEGMVTKSQLSGLLSLPEVKKGAAVWYPYTGENIPKEEVYKDILNLPLYVGTEFNALSMAGAIEIAEGSFPEANEVAVSYDFSKKEKLRVGSEILLPFPPYGKQKVKVSAIFAKHEKVTNLMVFDRHWLSKKLKQPDQASTVYLKLHSYELKEKAAQKIKQMYPRMRIDSRNYMDKERENISGIKPIVTGLIVISVFASVLIVIGTLQISVREKQRDLATLRLLGAKTNQIMQLIMFESLFIGIFSVICGTVLGVGLSYLSKNLIEMLMKIPMQGIEIPWAQVSVSCLAMVAIIALSGAIPGYMAKRLSPMAAYQRNMADTVFTKVNNLQGSMAFVLSLLFVAVFVANTLMNWGEWVSLLSAIGFALCILFGLPWTLTMAMRMQQWLLTTLFGSEGMLASRNALRQMRKSIQIAGVLMLALSVGCMGTMILQSIFQQGLSDIQQEYPVRYMIKSSERGSGFSPFLSQQISRIKGVQSVPVHKVEHLLTLNLKKSDFNAQFFTVNGKKQIHFGISATDLTELDRLIPITVVKGTIDQEALKKNGVVIGEQTAKNWGYKLGDTIQLAKFDDVFVKGKKEYPTLSLKVVGMIKASGLNRIDETQIFTDAELLRRQFGTYETKIIYFNIADKARETAIREQIQSILDNGFGDLVLYDREEEIRTLYQQMQQRWFILIASTCVIVIIALLGLFNSMASSLRERIREFGVLRAIGVVPKKIVRLALLEGAMISFAGGMLGLFVGVLLGYQLLHALDAQFYQFPTVWVLIGIFGSPILGILATLSPGYWLARQELTKILQQE